MRIALVCDLLLNRRGAERTFEELINIFPDADIFTLLYDHDSFPTIKRNIKTSWLQEIPRINKSYRKIAYLFPSIVESFNLKEYSLIISSSILCAHGIISHPGSMHISYIHSPSRYVWYQYPEYINEKINRNKTKACLESLIMNNFRSWDYCAMQRVDLIVANSQNTKNKILKYYNKNSEIIYPPIDIKRFKLSNERENFYLFIGEILPYKGALFLANALKDTKYELYIIGKGIGLKELKESVRKSQNIHVLGWQSDEVVNDYLTRCKALIVPGEEDFGLTSIEAQACGKPVLAFKKGGALESIIPGKTGLFFEKQTKTELLKKIIELDSVKFDPLEIRENACKFSRSVFIEKWKKLVNYAEKKYED